MVEENAFLLSHKTANGRYGVQRVEKRNEKKTGSGFFPILIHTD